MYEANPMSLILEQAGGAAFDGQTEMLDVKPVGLHQRVAVFMGSKRRSGLYPQTFNNHKRRKKNV